METPDFCLAILDTAPVLIWRAGTDARCNWFNATWLAFTGRTPEQEYGDGWAEGVYPDDLQPCIKGYLDAFQARRPFELEYRLRRHDGQFRWILDCGMPLHSPEGDFTGYIGYCFDITERIRMLRTLKESESRFRSLFEHSPIAYQSLDLNGRYLDVNDKLCELLGYSREELLGKCFGDIWVDENKPLFPAAFSLAKRQGQAVAELQLLKKTGETVTVMLSGRTQRDQDGAFVRTHCILTDITEQKRTESLLREQKESLSAIFENALDAVLLMNADGIVTSWNSQAERIFGWPRQEAVGQVLHRMIIPARHRDSHVRGMQQFLASGKGPIVHSRIEISALHRDGHEFPIELAITPLKIAGKYEFSAFIRDITKRREREEALRLAATVFATVDEAVLVTDPDNRIIAINPAFTAITGYAAEEVIGKNPRILSSGTHPPAFYRELWDTLTTTGSWHGEIWNRRKSGELYIEWLSIKSVKNDKGKLTQHVAVFSDISERKAAEEQVRYLAHYDPLTELPNRALITDRLRQALARAKRDNARMAVLFLDLDEFKPVNDRLGHHVGDLLLKYVAERLLECVRESDTVARLGGDEFIVLLPAIEDEQDAIRVAEKIRHALTQPFDLAGQLLRISTSIGIAIYPEHGGEDTLLVKTADTAMYHAKKSGRNTVKLYRPDMPAIGR